MGPQADHGKRSVPRRRLLSLLMEQVSPTGSRVERKWAVGWRKWATGTSQPRLRCQGFASTSARAFFTCWGRSCPAPPPRLLPGLAGILAARPPCALQPQLCSLHLVWNLPRLHLLPLPRPSRVTTRLLDALASG